MQTTEILSWLKIKDAAKLNELWAQADAIRKQYVGDEVHLRGLLEISNYCVRQCAYCGINANMCEIERYRMNSEEILACAKQVVKLGYGTVVMQAGEDYGIDAAWLADIVRTIKTETDLAVTLSLGERPFADLKLWREAGADRYLLRFETSDSALYQLIHPTLPNADPKRDRFAILQELKQLSYAVGSGVMLGIPGQTYASLANDIQKFAEFDLDMIGIGPYIPHPLTQLGDGSLSPTIEPQEQVPNTELITYKAIALTRIVCPEANIPSTTALATLNKMNGRELGLVRGANIVMPNVTPPKYRVKYELYPNKACINETAEQCQHCLSERISSIGRTIGKGPGHRHKNKIRY